MGNIIEQYAGIVTLVILGLIGGNMIKEGISDLREARAAREAGGDVCDFAPDAAALTLKVVLVQAVATSIDAFAVGVSLRAASVNIAEAAIIITLTTFLCCVVALAIGKRFGSMLGERAEIVGGVVLVIIGVKALFS